MAKEATLTAERTLTKWGGGIGVNIPKPVANTLELETGDHVVLQSSIKTRFKSKSKDPRGLTFLNTHSRIC